MMLRFSTILAFALVCVLAVPAYASKNPCYSVKEAEAEQGIRIHSELMVIGLNCQHMTPPGKTNFYAQYRQFTSTHQDLFADYEGRLMNYYRKSGHRNPESSLNDLRTDFANKISKDAADMRPDVFCSRYIDRLEKVSAMDRPKLVKWASTFYPSHPVSRPICQ